METVLRCPVLTCPDLPPNLSAFQDRERLAVLQREPLAHYWPEHLRREACSHWTATCTVPCVPGFIANTITHALCTEETDRTGPHGGPVLELLVFRGFALTVAQDCGTLTSTQHQPPRPKGKQVACL
jgi:hypothetical protein